MAVKEKVVSSDLKMKENVENIDADKDNKHNSRTEKQLTSLGVVTKRQGGGTLIESRPIFSHDVNYIYVNCGWGLRAFSVKTGECIKAYDASKHGNVLDSLLFKNRPSAFTSEGYFISWEGKSGKIVHKCRIAPLPKFPPKRAYLIHSSSSLDHFDLCITFLKGSSKKVIVLFFNPLTGKRLQHPLNETELCRGDMKHNLSFGGRDGKNIVAAISSEGLNIFSLSGKERVLRLIASGGRSWTCVRCHPNQEIVAVGDNTGRVVVYTNPLTSGEGNRTPKAVYHWHTLACQDIAFSPAGSSMYSGGGENVLVKWHLENPNIRYFLPRLSADIVHINVASDNQLVAVATLDNAIQVVEPPIRLKCVLQQLAWGVLPTPFSTLFPAGLIYEPRSRALVLNGRVGHLQFYSPSSETILFSVDVTLQNYMTQERSQVIVNTEVTHSAITSDGTWLATIETRDDPGVALELRLKLWQFNNTKKSFILNSSIELPHDGKICTIVFQPCSKNLSTNEDINLDYLLATTGTDKKFRLWSPQDLNSIYKNGVSWVCENTCYYRGLNCGPASFSEDGSLIAVGFGSSLTVWDVDSVQLKETLTIGSEDIKLIAFGMKECFHLLVSTTDGMLFVWNLLTLGLSWKVPVKTTILTVDPCSTYMAAFTADNKLYVFSPLSTDPVYESEKVCNRNATIISAIFMPRERAFLEGPHWLQNSLLYYIDSNQELTCFETEEESGEVSMLKLAHDSDPGTLFSALLSSQRTANTKNIKTDNEPLHFGILGAAAVTQLLQAPAHTMPPVSLLCSSLLQSLILSKRTYEKNANKDKKNINSEDDVEEEKSSSESDSEEEQQNNNRTLSATSMNIGSSKESLNTEQVVSANASKKSDASDYISELFDSIDNNDGLFEIVE